MVRNDPPPPELYVATSTGEVRVAGQKLAYYSGRTIVRRGHALLTAMPGRFRPLVVDYDVAPPSPAARTPDREPARAPESAQFTAPKVRETPVEKVEPKGSGNH